ncbi:cytidylyltransferase domain-containing protein [Halorubrum sp. SY-15]|uniref:acylneuraminate cytidylyltransferase family protein n=1 Tax=Halorubrum sp. SY-15 TaxID=3402277 RepID=UPI003EB8640D
MTDTENVLCTICARGESKGIPNKNLREVGSKPLIAHTIEHAVAWNRQTEVVVSTDSEMIADIAREYGATVPFIRPDRLATDTAAKLPVIQHAVTEAEQQFGTTYDYVVDLDATAPIREIEDIDNCFDLVADGDAQNAYTVTEADKNPYFNMVELDEMGYASLSKTTESGVVRRQDAPTVYEMNASIYVFERDFLLQADSVHGNKTKASVMPPERSVDIDRPIDLAFVEFLLENGIEYL